MNKTITFIDSGAFSLWQSGKDDIDVCDYGDYLLRQRHLFDHCVNLDVIPGKPRFPPSTEQAEIAVAKSWENLRHLESLGLNPIPIYHQGEDDEALWRIIEADYDYVGISPDNSVSIKKKQDWLDSVFYRITDNQGWPIIKTHGFGISSVTSMFRYPWFSCDSTTWKAVAKYGDIYIPYPKPSNDGFDFTRPPFRMPISDLDYRKDVGFDFPGGPSRRKEHFDGQPDILKAQVRSLVESYGLSIEQLQLCDKSGYGTRCRFNARIQLLFEQGVPVNPYRSAYFGLDKFQTSGGLQVGPRKLIFATEPSPGENEWLTVEGIDSRLLSYHKLRPKKDDYLEQYMSSW